GSRSVTIPEQVVGRDGSISVPFAGRIPVAGKLPVQVQHEIEKRLADKAIEPQVIVTISKSLTNSVTVTGEVVNGARVPLSLKGDRLLDLIAAAGGAKSPVYETFVRLSRDGVTATIPMEALVSNPEENIYAQPGDVLTLVRRPQTYTVFGATGANAQLPFSSDRMTLVEALAAAGGQGARPAAARHRPGGQLAGGLSPGPERCAGVLPGAALSDRGQGHYLRGQCRPERAAKVLHPAQHADRPGDHRDRGQIPDPVAGRRPAARVFA